MSGGASEAEATFWGQLLIMRMNGRRTILGECCTWDMMYLVYAVLSVYAVLGVNSSSWHGEIDRDDLTFCSAMIVDLWTRQREIRDEDENDVVDMSGHDKSGVRSA